MHDAARALPLEQQPAGVALSQRRRRVAVELWAAVGYDQHVADLGRVAPQPVVSTVWK